MLAIFVVSVVSGALYALAAVGLVVTYRSSGVFNFAYGAIGMFCAYCYWYFTIRLSWPVVPSLLLVVLGIAPVIGIILERLFRPLKQQAIAVSIVVSLGVLAFIQGLALVIFGSQNQRINPFFSNGGVRIFGVLVTWDDWLAVGVVVVLTVGLSIFLKRTPAGRRMRAAIDNQPLTELSGVSSNAVSRLAWIIGTSFAGLAGILLSEFIGLDVQTLTLVVIAAFSAAMLGRLQSLPLAVLGGFVVALGQNYLTRYAHGALSGLEASWSFVLLYVTLVLYRNHLPRERRQPVDAEERLWRPARTLSGIIAAALGVLVLLLCPVFLSSQNVFNVNALVIFALILLSLVVLTGYSGQVSLAQASFVGIGAFTAGHVGTSTGGGFLLALLIAVAIAAPASLIVGLPSLRLSGLFLALATMAFALMMDNLVFQTSAVSGGLQGVQVTPPSFFGLNFTGTNEFYYLSVFFLVVFGLFTGYLRRSRFGRRLQALRDAPDGLATLGVSVSRTKLAVFGLSASMAAMAGVLYGIYQVNISASSFSMLTSVSFLVAGVIGGIASVPGAVLGGLILAFPQFIQSSSGTFDNWFALGVGLAVINLATYPNGLISYYRRQIAAVNRNIARHRARLATSPGPPESGEVVTEVVELRDGQTAPTGR